MTREEIEKSFEVFISIPNNYQLLKEFTDEIGLFEICKDYVPKDKTKSKDKEILICGFSFYERVLQYCTHVYIFRDQPFELINVLKSRLTEIEIEIRRPFINAILKILTNKLRFPFPSEILIQEIERIDVNQEYDFFEINGQTFKAPVKDNDSFNLLKFEAYGTISYGKKSKEKIVDEFIEENIDKELFEILEKKLPKFNSEHKQNESLFKLKSRDFEPLKWMKDTVLLAYLLNELKKYGFINDTNIWAICENIFLDKKGNPIKSTTFTSFVKNYENNINVVNPGNKGLPKKHSEITQIISSLRDISKQLE